MENIDSVIVRKKDNADTIKALHVVADELPPMLEMLVQGESICISALKEATGFRLTISAKKGKA